MPRIKLTEERIKATCKAVELGMTYERAAEFAGIDRSTFFLWKAKGENAKSGLYKTFSDSLKEANAKAEQLHLKNINNHALGNQVVKETKTTTAPDGSVTKTETEKKAPGTWQASGWILERRFPDRYGRNRSVDTEDNQPLPWCDDEPDPLGLDE